MIKILQKSAGFTLVEVVVAMSVLSVGILGLASLQATMLKANTSSLYRSQATILANAIIEAMHVNVTAATNGAYDTAIPTTIPACANSAVLSGTIAEQDLALWTNALACTFPSGTGSIVTNGSIVTVTVQWDDSQGKDPPQQFETATML